MFLRGVPWALVFLIALTMACSSDARASIPTPSAQPPPTASDTAQGDTVARSVDPFRPSVPVPVSLPRGYRIETLVDGLDDPTSIAATPDGRLLITEQETGRVRVVLDGELLDEPWYELDVYVAPGQFIQELGLVSITVDPLFEENGYVYIYYTVSDTGAPRTVLARLRDENNRGTDLTELLEIDVAPDRLHIAGGMAFDADGALLVGVGDHERHNDAPRLDTLVGKVLRIDRDGNALPDNPFAEREDVDPRVYAYGLRNPYGLAVDPESGRAYTTENRTVAGDAVYELEAGADYGWPQYPAALREPLLIFEQPMGLAGITVYNGNALPEFTGTCSTARSTAVAVVHWARSETDNSPGHNRLIAIGCTTGIAEGADGFLYFLSYGEGKLLRISR